MHYSIDQLPETRKAKFIKFIKLYPGVFVEYMYPQFQNSQEFVLAGGVTFDNLANSNESHADVVFISAL